MTYEVERGTVRKTFVLASMVASPGLFHLVSVSLQVGSVEFALGDGVHRWRDQGHPCLAIALCIDSNVCRLGVIQGGVVSFTREHLK